VARHSGRLAALERRLDELVQSTQDAFRVFNRRHADGVPDPETDAAIAAFHALNPNGTAYIIRCDGCECEPCRAYEAAEQERWFAEHGRPGDRVETEAAVAQSIAQGREVGDAGARDHYPNAPAEPAGATQSAPEAQEPKPEPHAAPRPASAPAECPACARRPWALCAHHAEEWRQYGPGPRPGPVLRVTLNDLLEDIR
jgi:hypothetical protein